MEPRIWKPSEVPIEQDAAFAAIVTRDPAMIAALERTRAYAYAGARILIHGETGTGKELVAQAAHASSPRAGEPFEARNMACCTDGLADSELFGHCKGAFTGAIENRPGLFESVGAGTVLLDEIGDMDAKVQKKLLRVFEEHKVRRVGESRSREISATIICATNCDLVKDVAEGRFRMDLYHRLKGHVVYLPPLRERVGDIPILTRHFLHESSRDYGKRMDGIAPEAMECLLRYPFPGNVRELRDVIDDAVILQPGTMLEVDSLCDEIRYFKVAASRREKYLKKSDRLAQLKKILETTPDLKTARRISGLSSSQFYKLRQELLACAPDLERTKALLVP